MLVLNPRRVTFAGATWEHVTVLSIDRTAERTVLAWTDLGPYASLADVPEQRVTVRIVQELDVESFEAPRPGDLGVLSFETTPAGSDGDRRRFEASAVVMEVTHELSFRKGALRTIVLECVSNGADDPVSVIDG
jgi:hypothetical protein